jgi:hypothetical protein
MSRLYWFVWWPSGTDSRRSPAVVARSGCRGVTTAGCVDSCQRSHVVIRFETEKSAGFPHPTPPGVGGWGRRYPSLGTGLGSSVGSGILTRVGSSIGTGGGSGIGSRSGSGIGAGVGVSLGSGPRSGVRVNRGSSIGTGGGSGIRSRRGSSIGSGLCSGIGVSPGSSLGTSLGSRLGTGTDFSNQTRPPPGAVARLDSEPASIILDADV